SPSSLRSKKDREALGKNWRRRIKGMLFFGWNFPISNNKLKLHFREGDLNEILNDAHTLAVCAGPGGRKIPKDFRAWLIKCHE
ncbi:unnamed protein product, partial [Ectocarpus sp. 4 AP-2014]